MEVIAAPKQKWGRGPGAISQPLGGWPWGLVSADQLSTGPGWREQDRPGGLRGVRPEGLQVKEAMGSCGLSLGRVLKVRKQSVQAVMAPSVS